MKYGNPLPLLVIMIMFVVIGVVAIIGIIIEAIWGVTVCQPK